MYEDEIPVGRAKDLRGQKFDKLTVLYRVQGNNGQTRWKCLCDCGNITYAYANNLQNNKYTHNCGCASKRGENLANGDGWQGKNIKDLTGQTFNRITVLGRSEKKGANRNVIWTCRCDCGTIFDAAGYAIQSGRTSSCGCLRSKGEEKIKTILNQTTIPFTQQKTFPSCINNRGNLLKFDFYINDKYLIEYDGDIHFDSERSRGWFTDEYRADMKLRDETKNQWCKENNIPLIRIPYTKFDTLCIEDLMLETTKFRIV